jgi:hypothetical protein
MRRHALATLLLCLAALFGCGPPPRPGPLGEARTGLVIGPADYQDVACHPAGKQGFAEGVARFRPDAVQDELLDACTAVHLPGNYLLTSSACVYDPPLSKGARVGTLTFGERATSCGGSATEVRRSYPAAYVRHDDGLGVLLLRAGPQLGGTLPPSALYPTVRFSTDLPPVGGTIALAAYQSTEGPLKLQTNASVVGYNGEFFYSFIQHDADAESLGAFYQEPAAGGALVYELPDDPGYWYVFGVHLGLWPLDEVPTKNAGMPFGELVEAGFLDGVPLGLAGGVGGAPGVTSQAFCTNGQCVNGGDGGNGATGGKRGR